MPRGTVVNQSKGKTNCGNLQPQGNQRGTERGLKPPLICKGHHSKLGGNDGGPEKKDFRTHSENHEKQG